jgi:glutamate--cysteine ligase
MGEGGIMSIPQAGGGPITGRDELVTYIEQGARALKSFRIGTEHEKFGFHTDDHSPVPYEGPRGIRALLEGLKRYGWQGLYEGDTLVGLTQDGASVSLEPGGQVELSGAPLETIHDTCREVHAHLDQVRSVGEELGIGFLGLGMSPKWTLSETPVMPKGRYAIMRRYMPKKGRLGLDMMFRTCTVQVNLDYSSEADMVKKLRVGLALQPIATALFANSPFTEGKESGYLSYRSEIWRDVDPDRTGMLPFAFKSGMGFEAYVDYALDVPMYFLYREGRYLDVAGQPFRAFLERRIPGLEHVEPQIGDWADHLTTLFPEVRVKRFMEMRGADGGPWRRLCALPALWVGLLYDDAALDAAWRLVRDWTEEEREALRREVPRYALKTEFRGQTVQHIAKDVVRIAKDGLKARARQSGFDADESIFLDEIEAIAESGITPAEELLARYRGPWKREIDRVFIECAY